MGLLMDWQKEYWMVLRKDWMRVLLMGWRTGWNWVHCWEKNLV
jgi:hypothetical protein